MRQTGVLKRLLFLKRGAWELAIGGNKLASLWCSLLTISSNRVQRNPLLHQKSVTQVTGAHFQLRLGPISPDLTCAEYYYFINLILFFLSIPAFVFSESAH